jgi:hypothetical protein
VVADLADLLSQHQHGTYIWYLEGLGTSGTIVDRVLGGNRRRISHTQLLSRPFSEYLHNTNRFLGFTGLGVDDQIRKAYRKTFPFTVLFGH